MLRERGHDVLDAGEQGDDPGDRALLTLAVQQARIIVTMDLDFAILFRRGGAAHAGVLQLPQLHHQRLAALLGEFLDTHQAHLLERSIVIVRGSRVRVIPNPSA
jgi:predicted nuclease of predicted toxin-antitoxin system